MSDNTGAMPADPFQGKTDEFAIIIHEHYAALLSAGFPQGMAQEMTLAYYRIVMGVLVPMAFAGGLL